MLTPFHIKLPIIETQGVKNIMPCIDVPIGVAQRANNSLLLFSYK